MTGTKRPSPQQAQFTRTLLDAGILNPGCLKVSSCLLKQIAGRPAETHMAARQALGTYGIMADLRNRRELLLFLEVEKKQPPAKATGDRGLLRACDFFGWCPTSAAVSRCGTWAPVELPHVSQKRANVGHQAERFFNTTQNGAESDSVLGCCAQNDTHEVWLIMRSISGAPH